MSMCGRYALCFDTKYLLTKNYFPFQHEILEELRRERIDELATLIQKIFRGFICRKKIRKLQESQMVIASCWKRWKDKSHITELKQRRQSEWATLIVQKFFRLWQVIQNKYNYLCSNIVHYGLKIAFANLIVID